MDPMGPTLFEQLVLIGIAGDVVIALVILVVIARWILRPLDQLVEDLRKRSTGSGDLPQEPASPRHRPTQFTILDLLCLFVLVQPPMALLHAPGWSVVPNGAYWLFDLFIWGSCGAMWWASVRMLSQADIHNPWHRGLYLGLVLPMSLFSAIAAPVLLLPICITLIMAWSGATMLANSPLWPLSTMLAIEALILPAVYFSGRFTRWMADARRREAEEQDRERGR